jgi:hypothetical protein
VLRGEKDYDGGLMRTMPRREVITRSVTTTVLRGEKDYDGGLMGTMRRRRVITLRVMRRHAERDDYSVARHGWGRAQ